MEFQTVESGWFFLPGNPFGPYFELESFWEIYIL